MRKAYLKTAIPGLVLACVTAMANAQAAQSPMSNQPTTPQSDNAQAQPSQMSSQAMSPQAQEQLARKVSRALIMLPYYGVFDYITGNVLGGTVTLEGQVATSSLKPDADKAVKKIEGVDKVVNNIRVLPPSPMDDRIRRAAREAIYGYGPFLKYANQPNPPIRILVANSRVTLEGVVDTEADKNLCTMRINQMSGPVSVLSVTNNLRVVKP